MRSGKGVLKNSLNRDPKLETVYLEPVTLDIKQLNSKSNLKDHRNLQPVSPERNNPTPEHQKT